MKTIITAIIVFSVFCLASCAKTETISTFPINEVPDSSLASAVFDAAFSDGPYGRVSGRVAIYDDNNELRLSLQHFTTSSGPDLHVYLAQESMPIHFIELGNLKSAQGNQVYAVPGRPDFRLYKYVLIHCQQFNHVFGIAELNNTNP